MFAFTALFTSLLLSSSVLSTPVPGVDTARTIQPSLSSTSAQDWLCKIPIVKRFLCPRQGSAELSITTAIGTAKGVSTIDGAHRFAVKYAAAGRWADSSVATTWALPNGASDPNALPLACPQDGLDSSDYSEDCLSMILYVPDRLRTLNQKAPVMVWIHGGSFIAGSATGPGLDGSSLALATNSVVAVIQYRLGALGFMAPSGSTNLAVRDVMNSLKFLQKVAPAFGADGAKISIAGQSSGAHMIRTLLATPSASPLFQSAILQSDPMDYGFLSASNQSVLQKHFNEQLSCSSTNANCLNGLSLDAILDAQDTLCSDAAGLVPAAGQFEPIRPVLDGTMVTSSLDSTATKYPAVNKPILISTVSTEAGPTIYGNFPSKITTDSTPSYSLIVSLTFGTPRTDQILDSQFYQVGNGEDARPAIERMGTDYIWKCSGWTFARSWVQHGGQAYVGVYEVGSTYPANDGVSFCTDGGNVCHQDDIQIVFGTAPNPNTAQRSLIKEMQARYAAFLSTGNPNAPGVAQWNKATTTDVHALLLGGQGEAPVGACEPTFWGEHVQYDYQFYST